MLRKRAADFAQQVWLAAAFVGLSPPRIADHIMGDLFPETCAAAESEAAIKLFRDGVIDNVKRVLKQASDDRQADFGQIDAAFATIVSRLKRPSYHVERLGEEAPVSRLIQEPALLRDAYEFMTRKGDECHAEAKVLRELYEAVTSHSFTPAPSTSEVAA